MDSEEDIRKEVDDMLSAGATPESIVKHYTEAAERWERVAAVHERLGNKTQQSACLGIAIALRRVSLLTLKLSKPEAAQSICANTFAPPVAPSTA